MLKFPSLIQLATSTNVQAGPFIIYQFDPCTSHTVPGDGWLSHADLWSWWNEESNELTFIL